MINLAILNNLTDTELLKNLDDKRNKSFIINELCLRLEALIESDIEKLHNVECPVCMAKLYADVNHDQNKFTLEFSNEK